jgi:hypothetical protein
MSDRAHPADGTRDWLRAPRDQTCRLAAEVSCLAGRIADTEEMLAATFERLARDAQPSRAASLRLRAVHALAFAERERHERDRWAQVGVRAHPARCHVMQLPALCVRCGRAGDLRYDKVWLLGSARRGAHVS